jgi:hypothetical protein
MYISDSGIWSYPGAEDIKLALADLVGDQRNIIDRAGAILAGREVAAPRPAYPLSFTAGHDLDLRYLLSLVIEGLRSQLPQLEAIAGSAGDDVSAAELAREAAETNRHHIDALEQLAVRLRAGLIGTKS